MKALITSGGHGTRLRPITHTQNKHLIPIANKPILQYAIDAVRAAGVTEIGILINANDKEVPKFFGDGSQMGVRLTYIPQDAPLGLAHVVKISQDFIGDEPFVFYLGDNMVVGGVDRFVKAFEESGANCHLTLSRVKDPERFGVPELDGDRIVGIEEKPSTPTCQFAVAGIYVYDSTIFEAVNAIEPSPRGELEISDAHQYLLDKGYKVTYSEITGWWKDTGKPLDLLEASRLILDNLTERVDGEVDDRSFLSGKVVIEEGARVINSVIRGPAIIGKNCLIENAYIGPFTSLDEGTTVINAEVEFSIVLKRCLIRDLSIRVEGSILGNDAQIVHAGTKPRVHRFMIGDQSRIELL